MYTVEEFDISKISHTPFFYIIGKRASGKTTLAKRLLKELGINSRDNVIINSCSDIDLYEDIAGADNINTNAENRIRELIKERSSTIATNPMDDNIANTRTAIVFEDSIIPARKCSDYAFHRFERIPYNMVLIAISQTYTDIPLNSMYEPDYVILIGNDQKNLVNFYNRIGRYVFSNYDEFASIYNSVVTDFNALVIDMVSFKAFKLTA